MEKEKKYNCIYCKNYGRGNNTAQGGYCQLKHETKYFKYYSTSDWGRVRKDAVCDDFELAYDLSPKDYTLIYAGFSKK